jgi:hypothetical protein
MADLNTNDLYKMIADTKTQADQVAAMAKAQPTFTENFGNTLRSQDATLSSAVGNYSDAVAQLFAHDKNMAASNTSFAPNDPMYFSNPVQTNKYDATLFAHRGQVVADSLKNLETRKAVLGDVVDKAVSMYQSLLKGKEADYNASKDQFASALSALKLEEDTRSNKANEAINWAKVNNEKAKDGLQTQTERDIAATRTKIAKEVKSGFSIKDVIDMHADDKNLTLYDIVDAYQSSAGKSIDKSPQQLQAMYTNAKKGLSTADPFAGMTANQKQKALVEVQPFATMVGQLESLKAKMENDTYKGTPGKNLLNPLFGMGLGNKQDLEFSNLLQNLNNRIIYLRSGKQINEQEYERIKNTMAQVGTLNGSNIDRVELLLTEFYDAIGARGFTKENLGEYFPGAAASINGSDSSMSKPSLDSFLIP